MKNSLKSIVILVLALSYTLTAQTKKMATDLPNISAIGNFVGTYSDRYKNFDVNEIEISFQHYLYPSVKADIFTALHKEKDGNRNFELEEGYVTFFDPIGLIFPNLNIRTGLGSILGKKKIGFGKINPLHPEQRDFVTKSSATTHFLGGEEGVSAEGGQLSYLIPLPFFSQVEMGYWAAQNHHSHEEESIEDSHGLEVENKLLSSRLWNSFSLSPSQEFEAGLSYLIGNTSEKNTNEKQNLIGIDLTFNQELNSNQSLKIQTEYYQAKYGEGGEERETQSGGFISGLYKFNPQYQAGIRFSTLGKHGNEGEIISSWTILGTKQLTETSKFRIQYTSGEKIEDTILAQFIFGMGPHSHVLQ